MNLAIAIVIIIIIFNIIIDSRLPIPFIGALLGGYAIAYQVLFLYRLYTVYACTLL